MLQIFTLWRKTKVSYYILLREKQKYHITSPSSKLNWDRFLATSVILIEESFYLIARKVTYYVCKKNNIFLSTNNKSVMLQIFTLERKNKSIILHSFARKTKVSYYITFSLETVFLRSSLFWWENHFILLPEKESKLNYYVCKKNNIFLSTNNGSVMLEILHCRGKTKVSYYILLREKHKYNFTSRSYKLSWERCSCGLCHAEIATAMY